jgi:hypothetical protein
MKKVVYVLFGWMLIQSGCDVNQLEFDNIETPKIESLIALPIGEFNYTLSELVEELGDSSVVLEEDPESLLYSLVYNTTVSYSALEGDFIDIGDVTNDFSIPFPQTPAVPEGTTVRIDTTIALSYPANDGDALDSLIYATGTLDLLVNSSISDASYTFTIIDTRDPNGQSLSFADNRYPSRSFGNDLANHSTSLERIDGENIYRVQLVIEVTLRSGESISAGESMSFSMTYSNQTFQSLFGNFGQDTIQFGATSFDVDFFETLGGEGAVEFRNPQINMSFDNSVGIPVGVLYNDVYSVGDGGNVFLEGPATTTPQLIQSPGLDQVGQTVNSEIQLNANNSTLNELFGNTPNELVFNLAGVSNPFDAEATNFFVPGTGEVQGDVEIRLPMEMKLNNLSRTVSFDLAEGLEIDGTDSVTMRIVTLNLLPFSTLLDVYFYGEEGDTLYQVPQSLVMATPFINIDFVANEAEPNAADIPLSQEGVDALVNTRRIDCIVTLNTPESVTSREIYPKWLSRYDLTVKLSTLIKLDLEL